MGILQVALAPQRLNTLALDDRLVHIHLEGLPAQAILLHVLVERVNVSTTNARDVGLRLRQVRVSGVGPQHSGVALRVLQPATVTRAVGCICAQADATENNGCANQDRQ